MSGLSLRNRPVTTACDTIVRPAGLPKRANASTTTAPAAVVSHHGRAWVMAGRKQASPIKATTCPRRTKPRNALVALPSRVSLNHICGSSLLAAAWRSRWTSSPHHQCTCRITSFGTPSMAYQMACSPYQGERTAW
jgi:hypothetical protein